MDQVVLSSCRLEFDKDNWSEKQAVSMRAVEDFKMDGPSTVKLNMDIEASPKDAASPPDGGESKDPFDDLDIDLEGLEVK